eukprot:SAG31_NODE_155_length_22130_cov_9.540098_14_plen_97_part_00
MTAPQILETVCIRFACAHTCVAGRRYFLLDQTSTELSKTNALHFEHSHIPKEAFLGKLKSQLRCSGGEESSCPGCSSSPRIESFMDLSLDLQSEKL